MKYKTVPIFETVPEVRSNSAKGYTVPKYRVALVRDAGRMKVEDKMMNKPKLIFDLSQELFSEMDREAFYVFCLDIKLKLIGVNLVSIGTIDGSIVMPRDVFKPAILMNAYSVIFSHNHPSDDPQPSPDDLRVTKRLTVCGTFLAVKVLDHVVCGSDGFFSMGVSGLIATFTDKANDLLNFP